MTSVSNNASIVCAVQPGQANLSATDLLGALNKPAMTDPFCADARDGANVKAVPAVPDTRRAVPEQPVEAASVRSSGPQRRGHRRPIQPAAVTTPAVTTPAAATPTVSSATPATAEESLPAATREAIRRARLAPDASQNVILASSPAGLESAINTVIAANPDILAAAKQKGVAPEALAGIFARAFWRHAVPAADGQRAISVPTNPGVYARVLNYHVRHLPSGPEANPAEAALAADAGVVMAAVGMQHLVRDEGVPPHAAARTFAAQVERTANQLHRYYQNAEGGRFAQDFPQFGREQRRIANEQIREGARVATRSSTNTVRANYEVAEEDSLFPEDSHSYLDPTVESPAIAHNQVGAANRYAAQMRERMTRMAKERARVADQQQVAAVRDSDYRERVALVRNYAVRGELNGLPRGAMPLPTRLV